MTSHDVHEAMQVRAFRFRTLRLTSRVAVWVGGTAQPRGVVLAPDFAEVRLFGRTVGVCW